MGLLSWFRARNGKDEQRPNTPEPVQQNTEVAAPVNVGEATSGWELLPAYLPVEAHEHTTAVVIAAALAAGDRTTSEMRVKRVLVPNPEHRLVTAIATALAAGALGQSSFTVKNIYKMKEEGSHAA